MNVYKKPHLTSGCMSDIWLPASTQVAYNRSYGGVTFSEIAPNPDRYGTYAEGKHTLFLALLHTQMQLDLIIEEDAVDGHLTQYETIYVAETHITAAATAKLAEWVAAGGCLFATAGAGMFDEHNRTNRPFAELIGAHTTSIYTGTRGLNGTLDFVKQGSPSLSVSAAVSVRISPSLRVCFCKTCRGPNSWTQ